MKGRKPPAKKPKGVLKKPLKQWSTQELRTALDTKFGKFVVWDMEQAVRRDWFARMKKSRREILFEAARRLGFKA